MEFITILFVLLCAHALCDYPLQTDFMAIGKSPWYDKPLDKHFWIWIMSAHCLIQAGGVYLVTHSLWLGLAEFACHFAIDVGKCAGKYKANVDQSLHIFCKVLWAIAIISS